MFGIKTYFKTQVEKRFFRPQDTTIFPDKGSSSLAVRFRLWQVKRQLQNRDIAHNLGWLYTLPHPVAVDAYKYFLDQNPNHLGNWTTKGVRPFATQELEREVIWKMIDLYHADRHQIEGYITSGGTESNIFSTWVGRKYLEQYTEKSKICLIKTSLTHYSVRKSADIAGIPDYLSPLNPKEWNIDQRGLAETVTELYKEGYRGFLLPLTLGYTMTGTCDNIKETTKTVQRLQKEMKDVHFFLWIDAALNGLIAPFVDHSFAPFSSPLIKTFVVDFHKFGLVPYPSGIVLYRKNLRKLIEWPIDYLPERDSTVLGSRPGAPTASIWSTIQSFGRKGYQKLAQEQIALKQGFIKNLQSVFPDIEIVTHRYSVTIGAILHSSNDTRIFDRISKKYGLSAQQQVIYFYPKTHRACHLYKLYFLSHVTKNAVDDFFQDLATMINK